MITYNILDLDGTVYDDNHRLHYIDHTQDLLTCEGRRLKYSRYHDRLHLDNVVPLFKNFFAENNASKNIIWTARPDYLFNRTSTKLSKDFSLPASKFKIRMRGKGDIRSASDIKSEWMYGFLDDIQPKFLSKVQINIYENEMKNIASLITTFYDWYNENRDQHYDGNVSVIFHRVYDLSIDRKAMSINFIARNNQESYDFYLKEGSYKADNPPIPPISSNKFKPYNAPIPPISSNKFKADNEAPVKAYEVNLRSVTALKLDDKAIAGLAGKGFLDNKNASDILFEMASTFKERNKVYGDNAFKVAKVMQILFPKGIALITEEDYHIWHLFELMIVKLTRFTNSKLTHEDSIHDLAVYAAMVENLVGKHTISSVKKDK